jgi:CRISPR/Cas system-associated exonuclease Cas4 (RecB family)
MNLISIDDLKNEYKPLLKEVTLSSRIDSLLEDMNIEKVSMKGEIDMSSGGRRTHVFHASMIGEDSGKQDGYPIGCGRKLYYSYVGAPSEGAIPPKLRKIFDTGTAIHTQLQSYLSALAIRSEGMITFTPEAGVAPNNNPVADKYDISGHTDGIVTIETPKGTVRFGLEIKTINDKGYKGTKSPHGKHITQATVYQACFDLPVFLFLYYNKNDSTIAEFVHVFDKKRWKAIQARLDSVRTAAMDERPPEREMSYQCSTCNWKTICNPPRKSSAAAVTKMFQIRKAPNGNIPRS